MPIFSATNFGWGRVSFIYLFLEEAPGTETRTPCTPSMRSTTQATPSPLLCYKFYQSVNCLFKLVILHNLKIFCSKSFIFKFLLSLKFFLSLNWESTAFQISPNINHLWIWTLKFSIKEENVFRKCVATGWCWYGSRDKGWYEFRTSVHESGSILCLDHIY